MAGFASLCFQASELLKNCRGLLPNTGQEPLHFDLQYSCGTEVTEVGADPVETLKGPLGYRALGSRDDEVIRHIYDDPIFPGP